MRIIEIIALENGAHRNQTGNFRTIPDGWALIPDGVVTENFPFGEFTTEQINGVATLTSWTPGVCVEPVLTPSELREQAYNTEAVIEWDGEMITVTQASQLWQYYATEGSEKASVLTALVAAAKQEIRSKYPD